MRRNFKIFKGRAIKPSNDRILFCDTKCIPREKSTDGMPIRVEFKGQKIYKITGDVERDDWGNPKKDAFGRVIERLDKDGNVVKKLEIYKLYQRGQKSTWRF